MSYAALAILPGLAAVVILLWLTPRVIGLSIRLRASIPESGPVASPSRLGGLAIVTGIGLAFGASWVVRNQAVGTAGESLSAREAMGFGLAVSIIFLLGIVDDIRRLGPFQKLAVQFLAASIVVSLGWRFAGVSSILDGHVELDAILSPLLALVWIVGVTNAINFIDGLDGLAAGIVAILSSSLMVFAILELSPTVVAATSCITGACLGFLRYNRQPARIHMGDSGSLTLGFLLATISMSSPSVEPPSAVVSLLPILALGLPVLDALFVMWSRFRRERSWVNGLLGMFHADRAHLHYLLLDSRLERRKVMLILYALASIFCLMSLVVAATRSPWLGLGCLGVEVVVVLLLRLRRSGLPAGARRAAEGGGARSTPVTGPGAGPGRGPRFQRDANEGSSSSAAP